MTNIKLQTTRNWIVLLLTVLLAFALRFWKLGSFPALNADEAALGYNAWSLLQTGLDEHGNGWPIHLQSFNDYKPALYMYLILPFISLMGLNILAVRVVGATLGVATVFVIYLLGNELDVENKLNIWGLRFGIIASFMLAISPWHIHFSRGGWEVNAATLFITAGVYFIIKAIRKPTYSNFLFSIINFTLALYTYHAARVVVPLLGLGLLFLYWRELLANWKKVLVSTAVGLVLLIPLAFDLTGPAGISRVAGVGIFSDPGPLNEINEQRGEHVDLQGIIPRIMHNKPVNYTLAFFENWGEHYTGDFLFISGDEIQRNKVPEHGQMYLHDIIFVIIGLFSIIKLSRRGYFVLWWLIVAPVAAALTFQSPHALRAQNMVVPLVIISAAGSVTILVWLKKNISSKILLTISYLLLITLILWGFARYQHHYWIQMPRAYPFSSQYGAKELYEFVDREYDNYDQIVITDRYDQPYILALFYLQYPPSDFQNDHVLTARDGYGFSTVREFDKFKFISIDYDKIQPENPNSLLIGTDKEIPDAANIIEIIKFPKGEGAYEIVAN